MDGCTDGRGHADSRMHGRIAKFDGCPFRLWFPFKAHAEFKKNDLDERQELYHRIAEQIWNPEILMREVDT